MDEDRRDNKPADEAVSENSLGSVSEHIVQDPSGSVSIPSLHLKSASKSNTDHTTPASSSSPRDGPSYDGSTPEDSLDGRIQQRDNRISDESPLQLPTSSISKSHNDTSNRTDLSERDTKGDIAEESSCSEEIIEIDIRGTASNPRPPERRTLILGNLADIAGRPDKGDFIALNDNVIDLTALGCAPMARHFGMSELLLSGMGATSAPKRVEEYEQDYATEELILNESRDVFPSDENEENVFARNGTGNKTEGESSLSTVTTEYKTLCEDFHNKIPEALLHRDNLIEELRSKLVNVVEQKDKFQLEIEYLSDQVGKLQQLLSEAASTEEGIKGQLSDFARHEVFMNEDNLEVHQVRTAPFKALTNIKIKERIKNESTTFVNFIEGLHGEFGTELCDKLKEKFADFCERENKKSDRDTDRSEKSQSKNEIEENHHKTEIEHLKNLIHSIKSGNPDLVSLKSELESKHKKEMEELRMYFEQKCSEMEKHYSDEVFSQQSKKMSMSSSSDSLNNCPEAFPFGSPLHGAGNNTLKKIQRSYSVDFEMGTTAEKNSIENVLTNMKSEHVAQMKTLTENYETQLDFLRSANESYSLEIAQQKEQILELKANLQTFQNTDTGEGLSSYGNHDTDMELEKVLSSDQNSVAMTNWPLKFITLKNKIEADSQQTIDQLKSVHAKEITTLKEENSKLLAIESEKFAEKEREWRSKRYEAFDKNRHLEEVIKERDGLKHMTITLQKVLSQLVDYFNICEDELNNTFVGELLKKVIIADENFDTSLFLSTSPKCQRFEKNPSPDDILEDSCTDIVNMSCVGNVSRKMHFAPNVTDIMTYIDPECSFDDLDCSQDISLNFKSHLDTCLRRLRTEAQELLVLSTQRLNKRLSILPNDDQKLIEYENDEKKIIESDVDDYKMLKEKYDKSEIARKELEESLAENVLKVKILNDKLKSAMEKISELILPEERTEIISEGYGVVTHPRTPLSLPPHPRQAITSPPPLLSEGNTPDSGRSISADGIGDKKATANLDMVRRLAFEVETATKEKEDLQMQLEAANKQLRSTRQFLEEQATEREQERDDFQKALEELKEENAKLVTKTQHNTRIVKEIELLEQQMRDMSVLISSLETKKNDVESDLRASTEKTAVLNDIIANLEGQLESKIANETQLLSELSEMKAVSEEQQLKMKDLNRELEELKENLADKVAYDAIAAGQRRTSSVAVELDSEKKMIEQMKSQLMVLVDTLAEHTNVLENLHEAVCSQSCSSPSEDVSIRNHKKKSDNADFSQCMSPDTLILQLPLLELTRLSDGVHKHLKAEEAALKRISDLEMQLIQLKDVSQELRTERDILQERMSEQSLKISSLQFRLDQTRHTAEAIRQQSTGDLRLQLDEALSEIQLLREALDSRDKQVTRLKKVLDNNKKGQKDQVLELKGSNRDIILRLQRELKEEQKKNKELQKIQPTNIHDSFTSLPIFLDLAANLTGGRSQFLDDECLDEIEENLSKKEKNDDDEGKLSARTLSDILSISEFDEPDVIMRKMELHPQTCVSAELNVSAKNLHTTVIPDENDIVPIAVSSNIQSTPVLSLREKSGNNCSLFPNSNATNEKDTSIEPRKIDFSVVNSSDEKAELIKSTLNFKINSDDAKKLRDIFKDFEFELSINENTYLNIVVQLSDVINELQKNIESQHQTLSTYEEQLIVFPTIKKELEELKVALHGSIQTMQNDKIYYNNQLEKCLAEEKDLKAKLQNMSDMVVEKTQELQLLKEDICKRENKVIELSREKHELQQKLISLKNKYKDFGSKESSPGPVENDSANQRESNMHILEQVLTEKNQQIDSLNANIDKLENIQKELNESKRYTSRLSTELETKCNDIDIITKINSDYQKSDEYMKKENSELIENLMALNTENSALKNEKENLKLTILKLESKVQNIREEDQRRRVNSPKSDTSLQHVKHRGSDDVYLNNLQKNIEFLQSELKYKSKDLNVKALEFEKLKLDLGETRAHCDKLLTCIAEKDRHLNQIAGERNELEMKLKITCDKLREEGNLEDFHAKLVTKTEECAILENEVKSLRSAVERFQNQLLTTDEQLKVLTFENNKLMKQLYEKNEQANLIIEMDNLHESSSSSMDNKRDLELELSGKLCSPYSSEKQIHIPSRETGVIQLLKDRLEESIDSESELKMILEREKKKSEILTKQVDSYRRQIDHIYESTNIQGQISPNSSTAILLGKINSLSSQLEDQTEISELLKSEIKLQKTKFDREKCRVLDLQNVLDKEKLWFQKEIDASKEQCSILKERISELMKQKYEIEMELNNSQERIKSLTMQKSVLESRLNSVSDQQKSAFVSVGESFPVTKSNSRFNLTEPQEAFNQPYLNLDRSFRDRLSADNEMSTVYHLKEIQSLLTRSLAENVRISETVKTLTEERRELQTKLRRMESENISKHPFSVFDLPADVDQQVRFLYGRYMRMHSYRKQLVFQKQYLVKIVAAFEEWEMMLTHSKNSFRSRGKARFRCVVIVIRTIIRLKYLVRRWHTGNNLAVNLHLNLPSISTSKLKHPS